MKIFSAPQIREWDTYTIAHEPVSGIELMERAATACYDWIVSMNLVQRDVLVFCGKGNNGGDGLVIARKFAAERSSVQVYILETGSVGSDGFQHNLGLLHQERVSIKYIQDESHLPLIAKNSLVIDALFGSGLNRKLDGMAAVLVHHINAQGTPVVSIDIPSGMLSDGSSKDLPVIKADHTLSFQSYKLAFMLAENAANIGKLQLIDIGLSPAFAESVTSDFEATDYNVITRIFHPRKAAAHKGTYGHALIVAGSYGKIGAAILSALACLRTGVGLLTCHLPSCGYEIMQGRVPEAMVSTDFNSSFITGLETDLNQYRAIAVGPGIGTATETTAMLQHLIEQATQPLVIDADALNILAKHPEWLAKLPEGSVITPHPKEFARLFGDTDNEVDRIELAMHKAASLDIIIVLKGHHTLVAMPSGKGWFNTTGNAGMATGGMGDVLTGMLTSLICQGYSPQDAAILGVFLHGLAGDLGAAALSKEALLAGDLVAYIGQAYLRLQ